MSPLTGQAGLQVAQLRNLDLQLAFERAGALRKDVENKLAPIDNAQLEFVFQIAGLGRAEASSKITSGRRLARARSRTSATLPRPIKVRGSITLSLWRTCRPPARRRFPSARQLGQRVFAADFLCAAEVHSDQHGALDVSGLAR